MMKDRRTHILVEVEDLVSDFLYYNRKDDEDLPRGEIEKAIEAGEISEDEIVEVFTASLHKGLEN